MMVEMGPDRLNHGIWSFIDPNHPRYEPDNPYQESLREYYRYPRRQDRRTARSTRTTTRRCSSSPTTAPRRWSAASASTSGSRNEGYLDFTGEMPTEITPINKLEIDWSKTKAWGDGGYYGRLFLNVEGREPNGIVPRRRTRRCATSSSPRSRRWSTTRAMPLGNKALKPEEIYTSNERGRSGPHRDFR